MTKTTTRPTRRKTPASAGTKAPATKTRTPATKTRTPATKTRTPATKTEPTVESSAEQKTRTGASLPVLVPELHLRHLPLPRMGGVPRPAVHVPGPSAIRDHLPEPKRAAWFGGLAGLAAFGVINWPVAGVVAVGSYLTERHAKDAIREELATADASDDTPEA